jgi:phosphoribosylformylglycinamidine cyclo-ligase
MSAISYKDAGVDRDSGESIKHAIKNIAAESFNQNVLKGIGLFSGFYKLDPKNLRNPVLVSSMDGVGTKVKVAQMVGRFNSIGEDLVNHCINDIMVCGADPLFFLDYIAADRLEAKVVDEVIRGISRACKTARCALVGGETAEMPGVYAPNNFDVAGAIVGLVDRDAIIDGSKIKAGDVLVGVASDGLHTNGFSLARRILFEVKGYSVSQHFADFDATLGEELLKVHRSYQTLIDKVRGLSGLHGIAHITGGGIVDNTRRLLSEKYDLRIEWESWESPPIFQFLQNEGAVTDDEMRNVFNIGVGLVMIVDWAEAQSFLDIGRALREPAFAIGSVVERK